MARIRKCDRCNETYEPYSDGFNVVGTSTYNMDNEVTDVPVDHDLCPKCKLEFKSWFEAFGNKMTD